MARFEECIGVVLEHEGFGEYVNNPADPGGPTQWGVSLTEARKHGLELDVDHDGDVDVTDIKRLSREEAIVFYHRHYWFYDDVGSKAVATKALDMGVNMGPVQAHKLIQRAINSLGGDVDEDGIVGPRTLYALNILNTKTLLLRVCQVQADFYERIAREKPQLMTFLHGWLARAAWPFNDKKVVVA